MCLIDTEQDLRGVMSERLQREQFKREPSLKRANKCDKLFLSAELFQKSLLVFVEVCVCVCLC